MPDKDMNVLGISASPRKQGNSDLLLKRALDGAQSASATAEYLRLVDYKIAPCLECNACYKTGACKINDDYQIIAEKMLTADRLIFATPIFFMTVPAQAKLLIDRCQCLWAHKYVLKKPLIQTAGRDRRAMVIAVGGSKSKKMFESINLTMKYYFDALDIKHLSSLFVNQIENPGQIKNHHIALEHAFQLAKQLADPNTPLPEKPTIIQLT